MPYFGFLTSSSQKAPSGTGKPPTSATATRSATTTKASDPVPMASAKVANVAGGTKELATNYDSEVNEWSELLTNEQEVAIHSVDLPPTGTYLGNPGSSGFVAQLHSAPDPWRLPPKQSTLTSNNRGRDWIEMRSNVVDSPAKHAKNEMLNNSNNVSGRVGGEVSRPPPPPPPTSAPLPLPPQPPPKKQPPNPCPPPKSAPPPPLPHNSRGELIRNKVQSDLGASNRGLTPTTDQTGSRTASPSVTDRLAPNTSTARRIPAAGNRGGNDKSESNGVTLKRQQLASPSERHSEESSSTSTPSSSDVKGPAPQPPTQLRDSQNSNNNTTVTRQPQRSMSVSRGLQVEEDDLIQFSDGQPGGAKKANNKAGLKSEELEELREGEDDEDLDDADTESARTADEQIDYLEGLEPCPCYAKCCLDSIITLFCVTLLG